MLRQLLIGSSLVFATTIVHAACTVMALRWLAVVHLPRGQRKALILGTILTGVLVMLLSLAAVLESLIWAVTYIGVGAITGLEEALYFSLVTFTTLGYGDIVMDESWRLLAALEAANGIVMFGWTTALIFAFVQRVRSHVHSSR